MNNLPPDMNDLEQRISALLRNQPDRRAPAQLSARVLAALGQRRTAPWWQRGFAAWPLPARLAFLLISAALAWLALAGSPRLITLLQPLVGWLPGVLRLVHTAADTTAVLLHGIPQLWLEGAAAFAALIYLATFALGATAYRALYTRS